MPSAGSDADAHPAPPTKGTSLMRLRIAAPRMGIATASLLCLAGCGGLSAGDYVVYRLAFTASTLSAGCYPDGEIPRSVEHEATSYRTSATAILYATSDDELLLDLGDTVLTGGADGDTYSFSATSTDVDIPPGREILDSDRDGIDDSEDDFVDADSDGEDDIKEDLFVDTDGDEIDDRLGDDLVDANGDGKDDRFVTLESTFRFEERVTTDVVMTVDGEVVEGTITITTTRVCKGTGCPRDHAARCEVRRTFQGVEIDEARLDAGGGLGAPPEGG